MSKQLLILDIDETLVYANEKPLDRPPDFQVGPFAVYRRPFLAEFVATAGEWFDLAVWSSASSAYVGGVVENLFGTQHALRFVWSCDRCTQRFDGESAYFYAKNLNKLRRLGFRLERVLMIDDSPEKLAQHYGNHVRVRPFTGDTTDRELLDLMPFLDSLRTVENLRRVEKRNWRQFRPSNHPNP